MDTGSGIRPPGSSADDRAARVDVLPVRDAVRTTLVPAQSVSASLKNTPANNPPRQPVTEAEIADARKRREVVLDAASREVIFRVLDVRTGEVVRQFPEEIILKLRAYRERREGFAPGLSVEKTA